MKQNAKVVHKSVPIYAKVVHKNAKKTQKVVHENVDYLHMSFIFSTFTANLKTHQ